MDIFKNNPVNELADLQMETFGRVKLSGTNTKSLMARLIRKEFDELHYAPQYFDDHLILIAAARNLELLYLATEMIKDLSNESGMSVDYILNQLKQI